MPVGRLFSHGLVRATITRKICFCWQSPETTRDTSVFLLAIGIAKNLECWHNLACSHLKAWIINITLEGKRKKNMPCHYAIIENVNHTVCLEIRFSDSAAYQTQNPVGFCFSKWISRNCLGRKKEKKTKQTRTKWGDNRLNISRLWNLSNLWNQRNLRNRYDEKKRNNNKYENTLTLFEIFISGIKKITL